MDDLWLALRRDTMMVLAGIAIITYKFRAGGAGRAERRIGGNSRHSGRPNHHAPETEPVAGDDGRHCHCLARAAGRVIGHSFAGFMVSSPVKTGIGQSP